MTVRGAARRNGGIPAAEVEAIFWPVHRWPEWARRLWFNGIPEGRHLQRYTLWKFFWVNGVAPHIATRWVLNGYTGSNVTAALYEARRWESYAADETLTRRYLLHGVLKDMNLGFTIDLATGRRVM